MFGVSILLELFIIGVINTDGVVITVVGVNAVGVIITFGVTLVVTNNVGVIKDFGVIDTAGCVNTVVVNIFGGGNILVVINSVVNVHPLGGY